MFVFVPEEPLKSSTKTQNTGTHSIDCYSISILHSYLDPMAARYGPTARIMRSSAPEQIRHADDDENEFGGEEDEFGDEEEEMDEWDMDDDEEADGIRVLASFRGH